MNINRRAYECENGHRMIVPYHAAAPVADSMRCIYHATGDDPCRATAHLLALPNAQGDPKLSDVSRMLAYDLGELLPWFDPAIRYLTSEHFDVEVRESVLASAAAAFVEDFTGERPAERYKDMAISTLATAADDLLGMFVVVKGMELRKRAAEKSSRGLEKGVRDDDPDPTRFVLGGL